MKPASRNETHVCWRMTRAMPCSRRVAQSLTNFDPPHHPTPSRRTTAPASHRTGPSPRDPPTRWRNGPTNGRVRARHRPRVPVTGGGAAHRRAPRGLPLHDSGAPRRVARDPRGGRPRRRARPGRLQMCPASLVPPPRSREAKPMRFGRC